MNNIEKLNQIVSGGYCIGCGACAAMAPVHIRMEFDQYGMYQPQFDEELDPQAVESILKVCPFSDKSPNEDELSSALFPDVQLDKRLGRYVNSYAGHVDEGAFREKGSSGGMVSWILTELMEQKLVDGVIHLKPANDKSRLFSYQVSSSVDGVLEGAKSKYYPMEMSEVLKFIKQSEKRYALVGVPCFIKAVRSLMLEEPVIAERIKFCIGLVCGHLKSKAFSDCFAWQAGIPPGQLEKIDFRIKFPEGKASHYGVTVSGKGKNVTRPTKYFFGSNWGVGFFKYSACEYCDDVFAETADVAVGDAWLPEYLDDHRGNSVVLIRSEEMSSLIQNGRDSGRLNLNDCSADSMAESQAGGLRHRRDGLSYRLFLKQEAGEWAPEKRVSVSASEIGSDRKKIYVLRETLRQRSHELWLESVAENDFRVFKSGMQKLIRQYNAAYTPLPKRILNKLKHLLARYSR